MLSTREEHLFPRALITLQIRQAESLSLTHSYSTNTGNLGAQWVNNRTPFTQQWPQLRHNVSLPRTLEGWPSNGTIFPIHKRITRWENFSRHGAGWGQRYVMHSPGSPGPSSKSGINKHDRDGSPGSRPLPLAPLPRLNTKVGGSGPA